MKKTLKVIFNIIAWIILILALIVTLLVFSSDRNNGVANLFGYIPLTVESDSMKPTFKKNDMIIVKEVDDINSLKKGDVITFWTIIDGKKVKNTHNVKIGGFGKVMSFLRTKTGFFVCILIPIALFFLFELYKLILTIVEVKRPADPEVDEEEIKRRAVEEYLAEQKKKEAENASSDDQNDENNAE